MYSIIQNRILRLHARHEGVLGQIIRSTAVLLIRAMHLLIQRLDVRRQETVQSERLSLIFGKGRSLVVE